VIPLDVVATFRENEYCTDSCPVPATTSKLTILSVPVTGASDARSSIRNAKEPSAAVAVSDNDSSFTWSPATIFSVTSLPGQANSITGVPAAAALPAAVLTLPSAINDRSGVTAPAPA
jgi:hypothetical protein